MQDTPNLFKSICLLDELTLILLDQKFHVCQDDILT